MKGAVHEEVTFHRRTDHRVLKEADAGIKVQDLCRKRRRH